jgi:hypothetical protein
MDQGANKVNTTSAVSNISRRALELSAVARKWWVLKGDLQLKAVAMELEKLHLLRCLAHEGQWMEAAALLKSDEALDHVYNKFIGADESESSSNELPKE